jgi:hypothetical protein
MSRTEDRTGGDLREGYAEVGDDDCITSKPARGR